MVWKSVECFLCLHIQAKGRRYLIGVKEYLPLDYLYLQKLISHVLLNVLTTDDNM